MSAVCGLRANVRFHWRRRAGGSCRCSGSLTRCTRPRCAPNACATSRGCCWKVRCAAGRSVTGQAGSRGLWCLPHYSHVLRVTTLCPLSLSRARACVLSFFSVSLTRSVLPLLTDLAVLLSVCEPHAVWTRTRAGQVCPPLKKFRPYLSVKPSQLSSAAGGGQHPAVAPLLRALAAEDVASHAQLLAMWLARAAARERTHGRRASGTRVSAARMATQCVREWTAGTAAARSAPRILFCLKWWCGCVLCAAAVRRVACGRRRQRPQYLLPELGLWVQPVRRALLRQRWPPAGT
jgi:hypothetical protein